MDAIFSVAIAILGTALVVASIAARQPWLDRHFLPSFFMPRDWYVLIETVVRVAIGMAGALLVLGRTRLARALTRVPMLTLQVVLAAVLAVAAGEFALQRIRPGPTEWLVRAEEPQRQDDPELGWVLVGIPRSRFY